MKNFNKHAVDFTANNYRDLLRLAKEMYLFRSFPDYCADEKFVIWRHDVDMSPQRALKLARIENEEDVTATYFFDPHSLFYNVLEKACAEIIKEIIGLGHQIGVHFDPAFYDAKDTETLEHWLRFERELFERIFGTEVKAFSFHCTTPFTIASNKAKYAGMINANSAYFREEVGYCSDSNGYWRFDRLEDVLSDGRHERLQVLTHPAHWQEEVMSPVKRYKRCISGRAEATWNEFEAIVGRFGRTLVDD